MNIVFAVVGDGSDSLAVAATQNPTQHSSMKNLRNYEAGSPDISKSRQEMLTSTQKHTTKVPETRFEINSNSSIQIQQEDEHGRVSGTSMDDQKHSPHQPTVQFTQMQTSPIAEQPEKELNGDLEEDQRPSYVVQRSKKPRESDRLNRIPSSLATQMQGTASLTDL